MEADCNKEKSCYHCPDRSTSCHSTCKFYIQRKAEAERLRELKHKDDAYWGYKFESSYKRHVKYDKKNKH